MLLGLTAAAVWAAASTDRAVRELQHLGAQRDAWVEARYQVAQEHSITHAYLAKPGLKLRPALAKASRALNVALGFLADRGEPDDVAAAQRIVARHAPSLQLVRQMLDIVDSGDTATANQIHALRIHPAYLDLQAETAALAAREQAEATASLTGLRDRQHALLPATFVAAGVGLLALGGFLLLALGHHHGDRLLGEVATRLTGVLGQVDTVAAGRRRVRRAAARGGRRRRPGGGREAAGGAPPAPQPRRGRDRPGRQHRHRRVPDHGGDAAELLQHADVAMYAAKQTHAGFVIYGASVDQHSPRRLALLGGLRRALEPDELVLHYQPKADLRSGRVLGVEALVRWQHPDHGLLGSGEFIPLAERTGLIHPLTRWVLDAALRQAGEWRRAGHELSVAVNVSTRSLLDRDFPDQVADRLAAWGFPPAA